MLQSTNDPAGRVVLEELAGDPPILDGYSLEWIASAAHNRARWRGGVVALARASGCRVVLSADLPNGTDAVLFPSGLIIARKRRARGRVALAILHELAHWLLQSVHHSHGDCHALSLALLVPKERLRADVRGLRAAGYEAPEWALLARLAMVAAE